MHGLVDNWEGYLTCRGPRLRSKGSQPYTRLPSLKHQCWEEEPPQHLVVKILKIPSVYLLEKPKHSLKGPTTDSLAQGHSPWTQQRKGGSGGSRDLWGETELCGFTARAGEIVVIVPVLSLSQSNLNLHWPGELHLLHPDDSLRPSPTQLSYSQRLFWRQKDSLGPCCNLS